MLLDNLGALDPLLDSSLGYPWSDDCLPLSFRLSFVESLFNFVFDLRVQVIVRTVTLTKLDDGILLDLVVLP